MTGDYSAVAYWYQHEPHSPRPPLPDPQGRRATFPWLNPVQWILLVAMPATLVAAALYLLAWS